MNRKSILMLTARYGGPGEAPYLSNELVGAWREEGHNVRVVTLEWPRQAGTPPLQYRESNGAEILILSPQQLAGFGTFVERISKWGVSSLLAAREADRRLETSDFDLVFVWGPAVTVRGLIGWAKRRFRATFYLYITDFFPYAARNVGLIPPGPVFQVARRLENRLVRMFDVVGCMSPANVRYLRSHYPMRSCQRAEVLPIWGPISLVDDHDRDELRHRYSLPPVTPIAVFGGQLSEGRGVEEILATARLAHQRGENVFFLLIGQGRLQAMVDGYLAEGLGNLKLIPQVPRDEYLRLAAACDVGLVVTVAHTDVPTFPSRTIDYLRAGLPIAASVERTTDYGQFVVDQDIGVAVEAGSPERLLRAINKVLPPGASRAAFRAAGARTLNEVFDVKKAARRVLHQSFYEAELV